MSVPVGARGENLTTVFSKAADMLAFVIRTTRNEKHIPLRYHNELGKPCIDLARQAMHAIFSADRATDKETIHNLLEEADMAITCLQSEIHLLFLNFGLSAKKANEWSSRLEDYSITFRRWSNKLKGEG